MRPNNLLSLSRPHARLVALLVAGALVSPMLYGCDSTQASSDTDNASQASAEATATSEDTAADTSADSTSTDASTDSADSSADSDSTSDADSSTDEEETIVFDYSDGVDENGHWSGITALDYVTLPADYASIQAPASSVVPTDDAVQEKIDSILSDHSTTEEVTDEEVADGDTINIDYVGKIDGVEFDGGSTNGNGTTVTIGTTQYIDDFLEQLIGHKPGETFDIEVTFPDDYGVDDLNGKDATFTVTINYIQKTVTPELTDDWVAENLKDTYGWSTVEEMREGVKENLQYSNLATYVQDYVLNNSTVTEVPQSIVDFQGQQYLYQYQTYATTYGTTLSALLQMYTGASTAEEFLTNNADALESAARSYLIFQAIIEDADITETDEELETYVKSATGSDDVATVEATYGKGYLMMRALLQKTGDYLIDHTTIVEDEDTDTTSETSTETSDATSSKADDRSEKSDESATDAKTADDESASETSKTSSTSTSASSSDAKATSSESTSASTKASGAESDESASSKTSDSTASAKTASSASTSTSSKTSETSTSTSSK